MITKTEAIVLRTIKYGEQRLIVDMFTRQQGRMAFIVPLPKSAHAKLRKQHFQPLSLLSIEADVRQQVQLQKLRETSVLYPLSSLLSQPEKLSISLFLSEFLYYACVMSSRMRRCSTMCCRALSGLTDVRAVSLISTWSF